VLYDRRSHGRSDRPPAGYDIDTLADDLAAVIEHFDLHDITLIAHSLGSKEAVRYLTRHGDARVARMVLVAPTTPLLRRTPDNPDGVDPELIEANYAAVAADVPQWCADFEAAGPYFGSSPGSSPGLIDWATRMIVETPTHVLLETLKINADVDMRDELGKLQLPVLIIHGDQDASAPLELTGRKPPRSSAMPPWWSTRAPGTACTPATMTRSTPTSSPSSTAGLGDHLARGAMAAA
jgi:pimeloyl-ACP methyl ester carboxylesterase